MLAKEKINKKSKAGKGKPKKVKLNVRVREKVFQDLSVKKQDEPLKDEPAQKNIFKDAKQKNKFIKKEKINFETIEKNKNMVMRAGVCFFMVLIMAAWVFNFKKSFVKLESANESESINWSDITDEFSESISQMKQELDEAKSVIKNTALPDTATGTEENLSKDQEEINELKARLEKLESKGEQAISAEASLFATTTE